MRVVDLSLEISSGMIAQPDFAGNVYLQMVTHEDARAFGAGTQEDPFTSAWNYLGMTEHTGTHVDAFYHMSPAGTSVDRMPLECFFGRAVCFDLRHIPPRGRITAEELEHAQKASGVRVDGHIVLLATGLHKKYFPTPEVLRMNPEVSAEAVHWLADRGSRMHGVEGPSTDILDQKQFPSHRACRDRGVSHYEWLVNLEELIGCGEFFFSGIPLRLKGGSGSPVRAFAIVEGD